MQFRLRFCEVTTDAPVWCSSCSDSNAGFAAFAGVLDLEELTTLMREFLLKETKVQRPAKAWHVPHRCDDEEH